LNEIRAIACVSQSGDIRWATRSATRQGRWTCALTTTSATATSSSITVDNCENLHYRLTGSEADCLASYAAALLITSAARAWRE